jgi:putative transcriptional regulator
MRITIDEVLAKQNRTRYWLAKECKCNYYNLCDICNGKTSSINFNLLQSICVALNVTPSEILIIEK